MGRKRNHGQTPTFDELLIPTLKAIEKLGGSGTIQEINEAVYVIAKIPEDIIQIPHGKNGLLSEVDYRLAWSRTYLKKYGLIDNSARGIWSITDSDLDISTIDPETIVKTVRDQHKSSKQDKSQTEEDIIGVW